MVVTLRWKSNGVGEQYVAHTVKTVGDLCGLARKLDRMVRDTRKVIPNAANAQITSISIAKD